MSPKSWIVGTNIVHVNVTSVSQNERVIASENDVFLFQVILYVDEGVSKILLNWKLTYASKSFTRAKGHIKKIKRVVTTRGMFCHGKCGLKYVHLNELINKRRCLPLHLFVVHTYRLAHFLHQVYNRLKLKNWLLLFVFCGSLVLLVLAVGEEDEIHT